MVFSQASSRVNLVYMHDLQSSLLLFRVQVVFPSLYVELFGSNLEFIVLFTSSVGVTM